MALIWNGEQIPCEAHVIDWRSSGIEYTRDDPGCGKRKKPPALFVVHYTGAENSPPVVYKNLLKARKSVEFSMDYHGQIWQFCDPAKVFCAHAKGANTFSFGMEIQSRGLAAPFTHNATTYPRGTYAADMPWGKQSYVFFTKDQLDALCQFVDALIQARIIPAKGLAMAKKDIKKRIRPGDWSKLKGVAGHYHVDTEPGKIDPGPHVFEELWMHLNEV